LEFSIEQRLSHQIDCRTLPFHFARYGSRDVHTAEIETDKSCQAKLEKNRIEWSAPPLWRYQDRGFSSSASFQDLLKYGWSGSQQDVDVEQERFVIDVHCVEFKAPKTAIAESNPLLFEKDRSRREY
jgi:hypothetical protein